MARSQLNIKISPELLQRVKSEAARRGMTVTELVVQALTQATASSGYKPELAERIEAIEKKLGISYNP